MRNKILRALGLCIILGTVQCKDADDQREEWNDGIEKEFSKEMADVEDIIRTEFLPQYGDNAANVESILISPDSLKINPDGNYGDDMDFNEDLEIKSLRGKLWQLDVRFDAKKMGLEDYDVRCSYEISYTPGPEGTKVKPLGIDPGRYNLKSGEYEDLHNGCKAKLYLTDKDKENRFLENLDWMKLTVDSINVLHTEDLELSDRNKGYPYSASAVQNYMNSCLEQAGQTYKGCACGFEKLQKKFNFVLFEAEEAYLAKTGKPSEDLQSVLEEIKSGCTS